MADALVVVGVNHRTAPVETREQLAVASESLEPTVRAVRALPAVGEVMLLATCNRVEVYASGDDPEALAVALRRWFGERGGAGATLYEHRDEAAARHAFRVCSSLDSLVVGEPQILGQVKEAFAVAQSAGTLGSKLGRMMARAFQAAKRVRTETGIASGQVSVASVGVDLARGIFGDLQGRRVLVLGAGKMALGAARTLVRQGATLSVANRSYERAVVLAKEHSGTAHPLTDLAMLLEHCDVVVCSTAAQGYVLGRDDVQRAMKQRRGRSLFLIDITVPRNVDPRVGDLDNVYLYNVDDLEKIVAEGSSQRTDARVRAERVLEEELHAWRQERVTVADAGPTIAALRQKVRGVAAQELERSLQGKLKHLGPDDRKALEVMLDAAVNKILHGPTMALRQGAGTDAQRELVATVQALFALGDDGDNKRG